MEWHSTDWVGQPYGGPPEEQDREFLNAHQPVTTATYAINSGHTLVPEPDGVHYSFTQNPAMPSPNGMFYSFMNGQVVLGPNGVCFMISYSLAIGNGEMKYYCKMIGSVR